MMARQSDGSQNKRNVSSQNRRAPDELFPRKGVPHQISAGLEILRNPSQLRDLRSLMKQHF